MTKQELITKYVQLLAKLEFWSEYVVHYAADEYDLADDIAKSRAVLDELRRDLDGDLDGKDEPRPMREITDDELLHLAESVGEDEVFYEAFGRAVLEAMKDAIT